jgi:hypothetical protein
MVSQGQRSHEYLTARGAVVRARKSQMIPQIVSTACGRLSGECERGTQECVRHNDFNIYEASAKTKWHCPSSVPEQLAMLDPIRALHPAIQAQIDGHPSIGILNTRRAHHRSLLFRHNLQR